MGTARRVAAIVLVNLLVLVLLFALVEGGASLLFIGYEIASTPGVPEQRHAEHDTLLGWVNLPAVDLPDFYAQGVGVRTNAQRFRGGRDIPTAVPAGTIRVICSGDSFTFGYGVGNEDTWCARLADLDPRLETVNMGLGGYGVDQAYLWYMRDGARLDHQVHIFAFLTDDFNRMWTDRFMGYGKPLLALRGDSIAVTNLPVPRTSWLTRRIALHGETVSRMNVVRLMRRVLWLDRGSEADPALTAEQERQFAIVARIFADLRRVNDAKGSQLVLVHLPGAWDYGGDVPTDAWRRFAREEAARQNIAFVDLVEEIRRVPPTGVDSLYAPNLHFTVAGNRWAADALYRSLAPLLDPLAQPAH